MYAAGMCEDGRDAIKKGDLTSNAELKHAGLKLLAAGLIQQNPLRDRRFDTKMGIFGKEFEE